MTKEQLRQYRDMSREKNQLEKQLQGVSLTLSLLRPYAPRERLECIGQRVSATLQTKVDKLTDQMAAVETALGVLDSMERRILHTHYIEGRKWDDVCRVVGYERSMVFRIHAAALKKLEDI